MINYEDYFGGLTEEEYVKQTEEHFKQLEKNGVININNNTFTIKNPKIVAKVKLCGGGITFIITDDMQFEMPTEEQRENLKKTFGIEIEPVKTTQQKYIMPLDIVRKGGCV